MVNLTYRGICRIKMVVYPDSTDVCDEKETLEDYKISTDSDLEFSWAIKGSSPTQALFQLQVYANKLREKLNKEFEDQCLILNEELELYDVEDERIY